MKLIMHFDGSCNSNTKGRTGIGVVLRNQELLKEISESTGTGTNNTAEYEALIRGMEEARTLGADELEAYGDSQLIIKQVRGEYRVKKQHLRELRDRVIKISTRFKKIEFHWIPREENEEANALAQKAVFG